MESKQFEDLYEVLDAHFGSSIEEINQNYRNKIKIYSTILRKNNKLDKEELWEVKLLKIARYILTNQKLKEKYDVSRIINSSDSESDTNNTTDKPKFTEIEKFNVPLRKDQPIDLECLANRQFERFDHKNFDLTKDRQLREPS